MPRKPDKRRWAGTCAESHSVAAGTTPAADDPEARDIARALAASLEPPTEPTPEERAVSEKLDHDAARQDEANVLRAVQESLADAPEHAAGTRGGS